MKTFNNRYKLYEAKYAQAGASDLETSQVLENELTGAKIEGERGEAGIYTLTASNCFPTDRTVIRASVEVTSSSICGITAAVSDASTITIIFLDAAGSPIDLEGKASLQIKVYDKVLY